MCANSGAPTLYKASDALTESVGVRATATTFKIATALCMHSSGKGLAGRHATFPVRSTVLIGTDFALISCVCPSTPVVCGCRFILPALAFNLYYQSSPERRAAAYIKTG
jgi:hypothetical protein